VLMGIDRKLVRARRAASAVFADVRAAMTHPRQDVRVSHIIISRESGLRRGPNHEWIVPAVKKVAQRSDTKKLEDYAVHGLGDVRDHALATEVADHLVRGVRDGTYTSRRMIRAYRESKGIVATQGGGAFDRGTTTEYAAQRKINHDEAYFRHHAKDRQDGTKTAGAIAALPPATRSSIKAGRRERTARREAAEGPEDLHVKHRKGDEFARPVAVQRVGGQPTGRTTITLKGHLASYTLGSKGSGDDALRTSLGAKYAGFARMHEANRTRQLLDTMVDMLEEHGWRNTVSAPEFKPRATTRAVESSVVSVGSRRQAAVAAREVREAASAAQVAETHATHARTARASFRETGIPTASSVDDAFKSKKDKRPKMRVNFFGRDVVTVLRTDSNADMVRAGTMLLTGRSKADLSDVRITMRDYTDGYNTGKELYVEGVLRGGAGDRRATNNKRRDQRGKPDAAPRGNPEASAVTAMVAAVAAAPTQEEIDAARYEKDKLTAWQKEVTGTLALIARTRAVNHDVMHDYEQAVLAIGGVVTAAKRCEYATVRRALTGRIHIVDKIIKCLEASKAPNDMNAQTVRVMITGSSSDDDGFTLDTVNVYVDSLYDNIADRLEDAEQEAAIISNATREVVDGGQLGFVDYCAVFGAGHTKDVVPLQSLPDTYQAELGARNVCNDESPTPGAYGATREDTSTPHVLASSSTCVAGAVTATNGATVLVGKVAGASAMAAMHATLPVVLIGGVGYVAYQTARRRNKPLFDKTSTHRMVYMTWKTLPLSKDVHDKRPAPMQTSRITDLGQQVECIITEKTIPAENMLTDPGTWSRQLSSIWRGTSAVATTRQLCTTRMTLAEFNALRTSVTGAENDRQVTARISAQTRPWCNASPDISNPAAVDMVREVLCGHARSMMAPGKASPGVVASTTL